MLASVALAIGIFILMLRHSRSSHLAAGRADNSGSTITVVLAGGVVSKVSVFVAANRARRFGLAGSVTSDTINLSRDVITALIQAYVIMTVIREGKSGINIMLTVGVAYPLFGSDSVAVSASIVISCGILAISTRSGNQISHTFNLLSKDMLGCQFAIGLFPKLDVGNRGRACLVLEIAAICALVIGAISGCRAGCINALNQNRLVNVIFDPNGVIKHIAYNGGRYLLIPTDKGVALSGGGASVCGSF